MSERCQMIRVSPGEHGMGEESPCPNEAVAIDENGVLRCASCVEEAKAEGIGGVMLADKDPPP